MAKYKIKKLVSHKPAGGVSAIYPAGSVIDSDPKDVEFLLKVGAVELIEEELPAVVEEETAVGDLDGDAFAAWLAAGAKVGDVTEWIGDSISRAEIAMVDERVTVQRYIEELLNSTDEDVVESSTQEELEEFGDDSSDINNDAKEDE